jgi:hypothetical protein
MPTIFTLSGGRRSTTLGFPRRPGVFDLELQYNTGPWVLTFGAYGPLTEQDVVYIVEAQTSNCGVFPWASGNATGPYGKYGSLLVKRTEGSGFSFEVGHLAYDKLYSTCYMPAGSSVGVPVLTQGTKIYSGNFSSIDQGESSSGSAW